MSTSPRQHPTGTRRAPRLRGRRRTATAVTALAAGIVLGACGSDADDEVSGADGGDVAEGRIDVGAIDYAYTGLPQRVRAGSELTLANASDVEVHELVAIRLPDDEERAVADLVALPPEELAAFFPLVETVLVAPPGETGFAVEGDGTLTEPGRYAVVCVIPTGADPAEYLAAAAESEGGPPEVAGGPPHIVEGMFAELTVVE